MKPRQLIYALTAVLMLLMLLAQMVHAQVPMAGTFSGTIDGKPVTATLAGMLTPTTAPTTRPVVLVPATKPATVPATPDVPAVLSGQPSRNSTGPTAGITLVTSGSVRPAAGSVVQNLSITGIIDATAGSITIRNCRINANGGRYGITAHGATKTVTIERCEIYNVASACVYGENVVLRYSYLHDSDGDAIKCNLNGLIEGNLIEKLGRSPDAHADGIQIIAGDNIVIRGNYFNAQDVNGYKINCPVFIQGDKANSRPSKNIKITGNWFRYGQFGVRPRSDYGQATSIEVKANVFYSGSFRSSCGSIENGVQWALNLSDKGQPVQPGDK